MATGILGQALLTAVTSTTVYTVPAGKTSSLTVNFCNQNSSDTTKIRLSITPSGAAANTATYMEYDANIPPNGVLERGAIVLGTGQNVIVRATSSDVSCVVYGIEE
jgi:hypothetical protein